MSDPISTLLRHHSAIETFAIVALVVWWAAMFVWAFWPLEETPPDAR